MNETDLSTFSYFLHISDLDQIYFKLYRQHIHSHYQHNQSPKMGSTLSEGCKALFAVPQGAKLDSLLCVLYCTSPDSRISNHKGICYAVIVHFMPYTVDSVLIESPFYEGCYFAR